MADPLPDPDALEGVFHAAVSEGDARGVDAALRLMAVQDPHPRRENFFSALQTAVGIADALQNPEDADHA